MKSICFPIMKNMPLNPYSCAQRSPLASFPKNLPSVPVFKTGASLQVNKILDFAKKEIKKTTNPNELEIWDDLDVRVRLIILYGVKDTLIPHLYMKNNTIGMWMALQIFFLE